MRRTIAWLAPVLAGVGLSLAAPAGAQDAPAAADTARAEPAEPEAGPWDLGATAGVNLAQSAYSSNWSGGDRGSVVWVLHADLAADRQLTRAFHLGNRLQLAYGQTARQIDDPNAPGRVVWDSPEKTTDQVLFESVGRLDVRAFVDPYLSVRFDTQFLDESDPAGAIAFNPLRFKETAGVARVLHRGEDAEAVTRLGFGFRQTLGRAFADSTGASTERFSSNDGGFEWQTGATQPLLGERVLYKGTLLVFLPVFYSKSDELEEFDRIARALDPSREAIRNYWRVPDLNFQNAFTAQITELLSVNLLLHFVYNKFDEATNVDPALPPRALVREVDMGVRRAGQFKQTLALGVSYTLL